MKKLFICFLLIWTICPTFSQTAKDKINRGNAKLDKGDEIGAISEYTKAINADPNDDSGYFHKAANKIHHKDGL